MKRKGIGVLLLGLTLVGTSMVVAPEVMAGEKVDVIDERGINTYEKREVKYFSQQNWPASYSYTEYVGNVKMTGTLYAQNWYYDGGFYVVTYVGTLVGYS